MAAQPQAQTGQQQVVTTDVNRFVGFSQNQITVLTDADFTIGERVEIFLKDIKGCSIILFHGNNSESAQISLVFAATAAQVEAARDFYAINLSYNKKLAKAMTKLLSTNGPLRWMGLKQLPFIAIYQRGEPVGIYNGSRTVQAMTDFAMTRACSMNFTEPIQVFNSVRPDTNFGIPGIGESQVPNTSVEFTGDSPLRPISAAAGQAAGQAAGTTATL